GLSPLQAGGRRQDHQHRLDDVDLRCKLRTGVRGKQRWHRSADEVAGGRGGAGQNSKEPKPARMDRHRSHARPARTFTRVERSGAGTHSGSALGQGRRLRRRYRVSRKYGLRLYHRHGNPGGWRVLDPGLRPPGQGGCDAGADVMRRSCAAMLVFALTLLTQGVFAQSAPQDLESLARQLLRAIERLSDYSAPAELPPIFEVPQHVLEAKVCDQPCNVAAAYLPREGIFLAAHLDPLREPLDRSALLHELVHYLQQGHPKFARLSGCERERAKEQEAYAIQNAYLAALGIAHAVELYDGELDCAASSGMAAH